MEGDPERPLEAARESGLVERGRPLLVLCSGGGDSVCLLDVVRQLGADASALHVNYRLREGADEDEAFCRELCDRLGVPLIVERPELPESGNLQEEAREARYALAERHAEGDYAAAHTASDQAETVLYRLAVSPGRRALLGMEPRRGRLVRPLLGATRADTRAWCESRGLAWREDPSNADPRFARARVRHDLLEGLRSVAPAAELTIAQTARLLREESELLDREAREALASLGGGPAVPLAELSAQPPALMRLVLRELAERAAGAPYALSREQADAILELARSGGTRSLDLGDGLRAVVEYGTLRFSRGPDASPPGPVELLVPGSVRFGEWEIEARPDEPGDVSVSAEAIGRRATVRAWREGDRMRPAGLGGTKTLQDIFTDRKVPRALRHVLPVVEARGEIAWVAGVALDERYVPDDGSAIVGLSARRSGPRLQVHIRRQTG